MGEQKQQAGNSFTAKHILMQMVAGGSAGCIEVSLMQPLDTVKTRFQVQSTTTVSKSDHAYYNGVLDCMRKMYKSEGLLSFWKGILPPILAETPKRAWKFLVFSQLKDVKMISKDQPYPVTVSMAGLGSGATEAILVNPFEVVKVRMQADRAHQKVAPSTGRVVRDIVAEGGVSALLFRGVTGTMARNGVFNLIYFGFYHSVKEELPKLDGWWAELGKKFCVGLAAGSLASCCNIPFDVAKSRVQGPQPQGQEPYRGTLRTVARVYRAEGFSALYKGLVPKVMRLGPGGAIMLLVFEHVYDFLQKTYPD